MHEMSKPVSGKIRNSMSSVENFIESAKHFQLSPKYSAL